MQSSNFRDKEILNTPPDLEGITRPENYKKKHIIMTEVAKIGLIRLRTFIVYF